MKMRCEGCGTIIIGKRDDGLISFLCATPDCPYRGKTRKLLPGDVKQP